MSTKAPSANNQMVNDFIVAAKAWIQVQAKWWGMAILLHALALLAVGLVAGTVAVAMNNGEVPLFESVMDTAIPESDLTQFEMTTAPLEVTELSTESLMMTEAPTVTQDAQFNDSSETFSEAGGGLASATENDVAGLGGFSISAMGPGAAVSDNGGVGKGGPGSGPNAGSGGTGEGFGGRGTGSRQAMVGSSGGTKGTERAVGGGLNWLARHQNPNGSWSFDGHSRHCKDSSCTCDGKNTSNAGATAFALLPYLAAGQTHKSKGPYQKTIADGIEFMGSIAKKDGDLQGGVQSMYAQGVATIVLCEAYGMSKDQRLKPPAQAAIDYICRAQHPEIGGWHYYTPGQALTAGDLSVAGWQLMALKSAKMSGLDVPPEVLTKAMKFLKGVSKGDNNGLSCYMVESGPTPAMTSVGLLSKQFLGVKRSDPAMAEGMKYMMQYLPGKYDRNSYYFYYATQVMHNLPGPEWDEWNRATRRYIIETQEKEGCAAGSWNPELPTKDVWADEGGRLLITSVNTLSLEVYYRFLPLYKLDKTGEKAEDEMEKPKFDGK